MRLPSSVRRLVVAVVLALAAAAGPVLAEPAQVWVCVPQHPFHGYDALTRGAQQVFTRAAGADAKVRVFRNPRDLEAALQSQRPTCVLVDASLAPVCARQGLAAALAVAIDGRLVRRRVLLEKSAGSGGVTATTRPPASPLPGSPRYIDATSDASALDAVRLGVARQAIVNWVSFSSAIREDAGLRGLPWRIVAVLPEEPNAVLMVSDKAQEPIVRALAQPSGEIAKGLSDMAIPSFVAVSGLPPVSAAAPAPSAVVEGARKGVLLRLPLQDQLPADARALVEKGAVARVDGAAVKTSGRVLNDGVLQFRVELGNGAGEVVSYTTRVGDTLSDIAQKFLGDPDQYPVIARDNHISNPNALEPGTVLKIRKGVGAPTTLKVEASLEGSSKRGSYTVRCSP